MVLLHLWNIAKFSGVFRVNAACHRHADDQASEFTEQCPVLAQRQGKVEPRMLWLQAKPGRRDGFYKAQEKLNCPGA